MIAEISQVMGILETGIGLFDWFTKRNAAGPNTIAKAEHKALAEALTTLHFGPSGVLDVLDAMAEGREITDAERDQIFQFEPQDPTVEAALQKLVESYGDMENLPLQQRDALAQIARLKTGLRWSIAQIANHGAIVGEPFDRDEVRQLVARIEAFNAAVAKADAALRRDGKT